MKRVLIAILIFFSTNQVYSQIDCPPDLSGWTCDNFQTNLQMIITLDDPNEPNGLYFPNCPITVTYSIQRCVNGDNVLYNILGLSFNFDQNDPECSGLLHYIKPMGNPFEASKLHTLQITLMAKLMEYYYNQDPKNCPDAMVSFRTDWDACFAFAEDYDGNFTRINCGGETMCCYRVTFCTKDDKIIQTPASGVSNTLTFCPTTPSTIPPGNFRHISSCKRICE